MGDVFTVPSVDNPFIGRRVKVTLLKAWQKLREGQEIVGTLAGTMAVNGGRTLIGEVKREDRIGATQPCPWSRNYIAVEVLGDSAAIPEEEARPAETLPSPPEPPAHTLPDKERQYAFFVECMTVRQRQGNLFG